MEPHGGLRIRGPSLTNELNLLTTLHGSGREARETRGPGVISKWVMYLEDPFCTVAEVQTILL